MRDWAKELEAAIVAKANGNALDSKAYMRANVDSVKAAAARHRTG